MKLILPIPIEEKIRAHAETVYPSECCGFMFGKDGDPRRVTEIRKAINKSDENRERRFRIDPKDYQLAELHAEENDLDFLGIYHSHPDHPAKPSEHDRNQALPYFSYVILSVDQGRAAELSSWRLNKSKEFDSEKVKATGNEKLKQEHNQ